MGLLALPVAELAAFVLVALTIGWLPTIALFFATSLIGVMVLKRSGANLDRFRSDLASQGAGAIHLDSPSLAVMLAGILLVFPGFITDVAGALLLLPWVRRAAGAALGRVFRQNQPEPRDRSVIDLEPDQWHQVPDITLDDKRGKPRP
jgi:UPF0716 protein FxsA